MIHGNDSDDNKTVTLVLVEVGSGMEITIQDEGPGLSESCLSDAEMPEAEATSGRGLALIKTLLPGSRISDGCLILSVT